MTPWSKKNDEIELHREANQTNKMALSYVDRVSVQVTLVKISVTVWRTACFLWAHVALELPRTAAPKEKKSQGGIERRQTRTAGKIKVAKNKVDDENQDLKKPKTHQQVLRRKCFTMVQTISLTEAKSLLKVRRKNQENKSQLSSVEWFRWTVDHNRASDDSKALKTSQLSLFFSLRS